MAREIYVPLGETGNESLYFRRRNAAGQYWRGDTSVYEAFNAANIALYGADADSATPYNALTEDGTTGDYFGNDPTSGTGTWTAYEQAGAAPAESDDAVETGDFQQAAAAAAIAEFDFPTWTEMSSAFSSQFDHIKGFFQVICRSDAAIAVDRDIWVAAINQNEGSGAGTFNNTTDSKQAIRDSVYTGTPPTVEQIQNGLATQATQLQVKAKTDLIPADPATVTKQDEILGAIALIEGGEGGDYLQTVTVTDGTNPVQNASVYILDTDGSIVDLDDTSAAGVGSVTADAGTYTLLVKKAGYASSTASITVSAAAARAVTLTAISFTPSAEPNSVTVRWRVKGKDRATVGAGEATVYVAVQDGPGTAGEIWSGNEDSDITDANGYVEFTNVPIPCTLLVRAGADGVAREVAIPATAASPYDAGELTNQDVD